MSCEGAQLLLALISCGDFLTVPETPGCLGLWEPDYLRKDELFSTLASAWLPALEGPFLQVAGPVWGEGRAGQVRHPGNVCH